MDIQDQFKNRSLRNSERPICALIRLRAEAFALIIARFCVDSVEKDAAIKKAREAALWANESIVLHGLNKGCSESGE